MRRAFTLMELMVSIALIVLIALFLFGAIANMKRSNETLLKHDASQSKRDKIFNLLYRDILCSSERNITKTGNKHYTLLNLRTGNSLHETTMPYVLYYVHREKNRLIRLESAKSIELPVKYEQLHSIKADVLIEDVDDFSVYTNEKQEGKTENNETNTSSSTLMLLYLKSSKLGDSMLFELAI